MKNIALLAILLFSTTVLVAGVTMNYSLETPRIEAKEQYTKVSLEKSKAGVNRNPDLSCFDKAFVACRFCSGENCS